MLRLFATLLIILLLPVNWALAQDRLSGTYHGTMDAEGTRLEIRPDGGGYSGTLHDAQGRSRSFTAEKSERAARAVLEMGGGRVLMQVAPMPFGAEVVFVPIAPSGALDHARGRIETFVRPGLEVPEVPEGFLPAPVTPDTRITGNTFLTSYEFWSPTGVRNGYLALPERVRTLMRFFPAVQLDVIFKLCLAPEADRALAIALRGQGVSCPQVVETIAGLQRSARFGSYKQGVQAELAEFRTSVRCAEGHVEAKATCDDAARRLSQAALSLRTAANVLARFR